MTITQHLLNDVCIFKTLHVGLLKNVETQIISKSGLLNYMGDTEFLIRPDKNREFNLQASLILLPYNLLSSPHLHEKLIVTSLHITKLIWSINTTTLSKTRKHEKPYADWQNVLLQHTLKLI